MIRPLVSQLIEALVLDLLPSFTVCVDFGMDTGDPTEAFGALQWAYRRELVTPEELDAALGDGPALTEIANRRCSTHGVNPYACEIKTVYDSI